MAMLACELDLPIGINVPLTLLSAVLAVLFTFTALAVSRAFLLDIYCFGCSMRVALRLAALLSETYPFMHEDVPKNEIADVENI